MAVRRRSIRRGESELVAALRRSRLTVKFRANAPMRTSYLTGAALDAALDALSPHEHRAFLDRHPGARFTPRVPSMRRDVIERLVAAAVAADPDFEDPEFFTWYTVNVPPGSDPYQMLRELRAWGAAVERVHVDPGPSHPSGTVSRADEGPGAAKQLYLESAPMGVDAEFAWTIDGGDGAGQAVAVVEADWFVEHQDLPTDRIEVLDGSAVPGGAFVGPGGHNKRQHGTKTLGVVAACDDGKGVIGLAPAVQAVGLSSYFRSYDQPLTGAELVALGVPTASSSELADAAAVTPAPLVAWSNHPPGGPTLVTDDPEQAVYEAIEWLVKVKPGGGGVLLIEVVDYLIDFHPDLADVAVPIEVRPLVWELVRTATSSQKIVVVAAAGNGRQRLEDVTYASGEGADDVQLVDPTSDHSGAILVGSVAPSGPDGKGVYPPAEVPTLIRSELSNFGKRVTCFAWGKDVHTTSHDANQPHFYEMYGGTSSAAAIIAGVVLILQGIAERCRGAPLAADEVAGLLTTDGYGTPPTAPAAPQIGLMPDLRAILQGEPGGPGPLGACTFTPELYLRDLVGDVGDPLEGPAFESPDVICRTSPVEDPQAAWGEGSEAQDDASLGQPLVSGQDHHVFLRVRNRGTRDAELVSALVFWARPEALTTPAAWTFIGGVTIPRVRHGDLLTVSPGIVWPAEALPPPGKYVFFAGVDHPDDRAPPAGPFATDAEVEAFVRGENNVVARAFEVT